MRPSERLDILNQVGRELQARYTFREIDDYLGALGIDTPETFPTNSKWVYSKAMLAKASDKVLAEIAEDLGLGGSVAAVLAQANPPGLWRFSDDFRLFISHASKDKDKAQRLKTCLWHHDISAFVAHEDIEPTKAWQAEIERALFCMDALVAVHTQGFSASNWTQQEVGFALGRGVKVISLKMGEDPTGFLSKQQALSRQGRTAVDIAKEINGLLWADPLTAARIAGAQAARQKAKELEEIPF